MSPFITSHVLLAFILLGARHATIAVDARPSMSKFPNGEPVVYVVEIKNVSRHKLFISRHPSLDSFLYAEIRGQDGKLRRWCGRICRRRYTASAFRLVDPGSVVSVRVNLACEDGHGYNLEPGEFTARVCYLAEAEYLAPLLKGHAIAEGPACSPPSHFEISPQK